MRKPVKNFWYELDRVSNLVELLITCHPRGFSILLGEAKEPTSREIHEMMNSQRVRMPDDFKPATRSNETEAERIVYDRDYFDKSVEIAGGWAHIHMVSNEYRNADSKMWAIVVDHEKFVKTSSSRLISRLNYVADRHRLSPTTVMKYKREFPQKLAEMLLMPPSNGDNFYLLPG